MYGYMSLFSLCLYVPGSIAWIALKPMNRFPSVRQEDQHKVLPSPFYKVGF